MIPSNGQETCECCKDVGVAVYRYFPKAENENQKGTENGQVFILQYTTDGEVNLEELILESGKKKVSCPRCMKTIQHVKHLLKELPAVNIREVTGICKHCYRRQFCNCSCCNTIVDKFLKFCLEETKQTEEERERYKSWLIKTQLLLKHFISNVKDSKLEPRILPEGTRSEGRIQGSRIPTSRLQGESEIVHEEKKYRQLADEIFEKPLKVITFFDFPEENIKPKPEKKKTGILKLREDDINEHKKLLVTPPKQYSFETVMKSLSEPNVSDFCYAFPHDKILVNKRQISSSEIIKYTQDMVKEREAEEKKKKTELQEQKEEKIRLAKEAIRKREETKEIKDDLEEDGEELRDKKTREAEKTIEHKEGQLTTEKKGTQAIHVSGDGLKKGRKEQDDKSEKFDKKDKSREEKQHDLAAVSALKDHVPKEAKAKTEGKAKASQKVTQEKDKRLTMPDIKDAQRSGRKEQDDKSEIFDKKDKSRKDKQHDLAAVSALKDHVPKEAKPKTEGKAKTSQKVTQEKDKQLTMPDIKDAQRSGRKEQDDKSEIFDKKDKSRKDKQHDLAAVSALKDHVPKEAKAKSIEAKMRKQPERETAFAEGKVKASETQDTDKTVTQEKDKQLTMPDIKDAQGKGRKDEDDKREKVTNKDEGREETQHDLAAVAKEGKMGKQQERETALAAQKVIEQKDKRLTNEKKIKPPELKDAEEEPKEDVKNAKGRGEKLENPVMEQKGKGGTHGEMAALLKDKLAKEKQQELQQQKLRIEEQKQRELAEKKIQELKNKLEAKEPAIKPPTLTLTPDEISTDGDEDVLEDLLKPEEVNDIIKGQKIYKVKHMKTEKQVIVELKQKSDEEEPYYEPAAQQQKQFSEHKLELSEERGKISKHQDPEATKGIIRYTLSDRTFIEKGWTMLPTEKVVRKMNVYRMRPAKPEFDWFEHNKYKREITYDSGEKLAEFDDNGRGRWYYRSGELALDYYDAEETNAGQRFVVYSTRQPDERGRSHPRTVLATFDYSGNGIVFDHTGKIRLKYNQTEGVVLDRTIGPVSHWKWHTLNDPPVLQQVMIDTQMPYKDPTILKMGDKKNEDKKQPENEEMIAIEFENFLKEKRQKLMQSFKPFQIKMKAMKINDNFSLRVLDQASVYLLFRDGTTNLKINLGMVLDHKEIVDTDTAEIGEVSNILDKLPACTESIAGLQKAVAQAQASERARVRHERRLKQPHETASVDALRAGCSRPLRPPIMQRSLTSCEKMTPKRFKPTCCEVYYCTHI